MRVSVVATGIDDEAIVTQHTIIEPARRAAETAQRRPYVAPRPEPAPAPAAMPLEPIEDSRPTFANDIEPERRSGFSLFGWKKPSEPARDFVDEINLDRDDAPRAPRGRVEEEAARDPALDEELEIPAFLRRQMTPR